MIFWIDLTYKFNICVDVLRCSSRVAGRISRYTRYRTDSVPSAQRSFVRVQTRLASTPNESVGVDSCRENGIFTPRKPESVGRPNLVLSHGPQEEMSSTENRTFQTFKTVVLYAFILFC